MTRKSRREIERDLEAFEEDDLGVLDGDAMWTWIRALTDEERDVGRPPAFFGVDCEWANGLQDMQAAAAERSPPLKHLTPPEAYVLSYMDDEAVAALVDVLAMAEDSAARQFLEAVSELAEEDT